MKSFSSHQRNCLWSWTQSCWRILDSLCRWNLRLSSIHLNGLWNFYWLKGGLRLQEVQQTVCRRCRHRWLERWCRGHVTRVLWHHTPARHRLLSADLSEISWSQSMDLYLQALDDTDRKASRLLRLCTMLSHDVCFSWRVVVSPAICTVFLADEKHLWSAWHVMDLSCFHRLEETVSSLTKWVDLVSCLTVPPAVSLSFSSHVTLALRTVCTKHVAFTGDSSVMTFLKLGISTSMEGGAVASSSGKKNVYNTFHLVILTFVYCAVRQ